MHIVNTGDLKASKVVTKGEVVRANMFVYLKAQLMLRTDFIIVYVNQRKPF